MKQILQYILLILALLAMPGVNFAQPKVRYVQLNSVHALTVPENIEYKFNWTINNDLGGVVNVATQTNLTHDIIWDQLTIYHVSVIPILDSVNCYGEPVSLDVVVVENLSLHVFDDVYYTRINIPVLGDVSENDVDEDGAGIVYNPDLLFDPVNGQVTLNPNGTFTYVPEPGFIGIDSFMYEAYNDVNSPTFANAVVYIVVQDDNRPADLYIEKTGPLKALIGESITYRILVRNDGPYISRNVILKDTLAFGLMNASYEINGVTNSWNGNLALGDMAANDSLVVFIHVDLSPNSPEWIYNQALTYSGQGESYDPDYTNNDSIWITHVTPLYVNLPDTLHVPGCGYDTLPGHLSAGLYPITAYNWTPATGLSDPNSANPVFTPNVNTTIGKTTVYTLTVTDSYGNTAIDSMCVVVPYLPKAIIVQDTLYKNLNDTININATGSWGEDLSFAWWTNDGHIVSDTTLNIIQVDDIGTYYLQVTDYLGCTATDNVLVLIRSLPPVCVNDTIGIIAGTDSIVNVLDNDFDINNFSITVDNIVTPPNHSTLLDWDEQGNIQIQPDIDYWGRDSLEYQVCNNGNPVQCSTAWLFIQSIRPPFNADVLIEKTGDRIAFYGDTLYYNLLITSNGPDTATVLTITDKLASDLLYPDYSLDGGQSWKAWEGEYIYRDSLRPGEDSLKITIRAGIRLNANDTIENVASVYSEIIENDSLNNTDGWSTKIKIPVVADAGSDKILGSCQDTISISARVSEGEYLSYKWVPSTYLSSDTARDPVFTNPNNDESVEHSYTYRLIVTDDDNISDTDSVTITVMPAPVANAGLDKEVALGDTTFLDGSGSIGDIDSYLWETTNGRILAGYEERRTVLVDSIGRYTLTVTDIYGCSSSDDAIVYQFYYPPFSIPDYYSIEPGESLTGNVLDNDYDPNPNGFNLSAIPGTYQSVNGSSINLAANGSFSYNHPAGFTGVDNFTYTVCNDANPPRCVTGYVFVTVESANKIANLTINKLFMDPEAIIGDSLGSRFQLTIENKGPAVAANIILTDSLSAFLTDGQYLVEGTSMWAPWTGSLDIARLDVNEQIIVYLRATVTDNAPDFIFNAATVASEVHDNLFDWTDVENRNVDTASVRVVSDLYAAAELVELFDNNKNDHIIGICDDISYLSASKSHSLAGIDGYEWSPGNLLTDNAGETTTFTHLLSDTTIHFTLTVTSGNHIASAALDVSFSPAPIADAGPDWKINPNQPYVIDATNSFGTNAIYEWTAIEGTPIANFDSNNMLRPIVETAGIYALKVIDMHGCEAFDTVTVRENDLFVVNDIMIVVEGDTVMGNVSTNDYDPDGDSIYFSSNATKPLHGVLIDFPGNYKSAQLDSNKIADDGTFIYVPDKGYVGHDYFEYEVCDDNNPNLCKLGRVYIRVIDVDSVNSPPVANIDYYFVNKGDTIIDNVLLNDYDFDGGIIEMTNIITNPSKGTLTYDIEGNIQYIPFDGVEGIDSFRYQICDNGRPASCESALVTIQIHRLSDDNHKPVAVDDAYFAVEKTIQGNILSNDYDPDGHLVEMSVVPDTGPFYGIIRVEPDGSFVYTPNTGFEGTDQMIYSICELYTEEQFCSYATLFITSLAEKRYTTDVKIVKTGPADILSGSTITYELTTSIEGPTLANDIVMLDTLFSGLTNILYSVDGGLLWNTWKFNETMEQLFLYQDSSLLIRGDIPDIFSGPLVNTAYVTHDMNERDSINNVSEIVTQVYQKVYANAGIDTTIGSCVVKYTLDGTKSFGMTDNLEYRWYPPELLDRPNTAHPVFTTEPGESQQFMLVVENSVSTFTDSDTAYVNVHVAPAPVANAGEDLVPGNAEIVLLDGSASTGEEPLTYLWWMYDDNNNVIELATTDTVSVDRSGSYYLVVTDRYGCQSVADRVNVAYPIDKYDAIDDIVVTWQQTPVDIYVLRNDFIDEEDDYLLELLMVKQGPSHGEVIQRPFDSLFTYIPEKYYFGSDTFVYSCSTVKNYYDEAYVIIDVKQKVPIMPEGFSPNGDGKNDFLIIENIELYEDNNLIVFNRWGTVVYEKQKYSNDEPWDGVANRGIRIGKGPLPTGVYFYILTLGNDEKLKVEPIQKYIYIASDNTK